MPPNDSAIETALAYHEATKHSVESVRRDARMLDWSNMPRPWKLYAAPLPETPLPPSLTRTGTPAASALDLSPTAGASPLPEDADLTLARLASVLQLSAGITKRLRAGGGHMYFRAAACTGALYHIELYVVAGPLSDLPAGVYHYGAHDNTLRKLRDGDFRAAVMQGTELPEYPAAVVVYTSTFWRNSWKYGSRAYRHAFWDCGTILANSIAAARANGLGACAATHFADDAVNDLVDADGSVEAAVALAAFGKGSAPPPVSAPARIGLEVVPLSRRPIDYPLIHEAHAATMSDRPEPLSQLSPAGSGEADGLAADRSGRPTTPEGEEGEETALPDRAPIAPSFEDVVLKRGSTRRFARAPIPLATLAAMLDAAARPVGLDGAIEGLNTLYVVANAVDGLPQGVYRLRESGKELARVREMGETSEIGEMEARALTEHLALDQPLGGDAAANLYFVADLPAILNRLGARGYRTAHLDASIRAGRVYLAAYALGFGATGLTFYDDEATEALGAPPSSAVTFLIAAGTPFKRQ